MSIRSELFVATRRSALRFGEREAGATAPEYLRTSGHGLTPFEFEALWAILVHEPHDPMRHQLENVRFGERHPGGWRRLRRKLLIWVAVGRSVLGGEGADSGLYCFPSAYVHALAALDAEALRAAADAWTRSSAMADHNGLDAASMLTELRRLASHAQATQRPLFLWGSTVTEPAEPPAGTDSDRPT